MQLLLSLLAHLPQIWPPSLFINTPDSLKPPITSKNMLPPLKNNLQLSNDIYFLDHNQPNHLMNGESCNPPKISHPNSFWLNDWKWTWTKSCPYPRIAMLQTISSPLSILFLMPQHLQLPFQCTTLPSKPLRLIHNPIVIDSDNETPSTPTPPPQTPTLWCFQWN